MIIGENKMSVADKSLIMGAIQYSVSLYFPFLKFVSIGDGALITGKLTDPDWRSEYEIKIYHFLNKNPAAYITKPEITPSSKIHMYAGGELCLYFPGDLPTDYKFTIACDVIPWAIKWIHYYEIYLTNGNIWTGPEAPHGLQY